MIRKNLVNKKVVSSIGIGIMAFVTATSPTLTVLAEEADAALAPELVVDTNTSELRNQEPVKSEQSQAVETAQGEIAGATVENADNKALEDINAALSGANEALDDIKENVDKLDAANVVVEEKNEALNDQLKDEDGVVRDQVNTVASSSEGVIDAVDNLTDENVKKIEEDAATAEEAADKKYENKEEAEKAEVQVGNMVENATSEDGLLGTVEKAEEKFEEAEDALNAVEDQIGRIKDAQNKANDAADAA